MLYKPPPRLERLMSEVVKVTFELEPPPVKPGWFSVRPGWVQEPCRVLFTVSKKNNGVAEEDEGSAKVATVNVWPKAVAPRQVASIKVRVRFIRSTLERMHRQEITSDPPRQIQFSTGRANWGADEYDFI